MGQHVKTPTELKGLVGHTITARVHLHNYRFPKDHVHLSGDFAIVIFDIESVTEGTVVPACLTSTGGIVVTGILPHIEDGMSYIVTGKLIIDPKWGPQYTCQDIHLAYNLTKVEDQKTFFSYFLTQRQIDSLFEMFDNPIQLLEQKNVGALTKIKGIGPATATRICMKYSDNVCNSRAYVELANLGLTKNAIDRIVKQFGSADMAIDVIKKNPYSLIKLARGYGWEKADRIALAQGFGRGCRERCLAYVEYRLDKLAQEDGNSRMPVDDLLNELTELCLPTDRAQIATWIKEVTVGDKDFEQIYFAFEKGQKNPNPPLLYYSNTERYIGLYNLRLTERRIADEITRLKHASNSWHFDAKKCETIIAQVEAEQGYLYTHEQKKAIWNILDSNVSILTGSSGCGKSSTLKPLIRIFNAYGISVAQCALSGRASSLLTEYTGLTGKTIHRLLGYIADEERFVHDANTPLSEDVIILDEASMVGEELFLSLISSIRSGAKLLLLGDTKQLPPISVGNILGDCIRSGYINTNTLTIIQRQAMRSGIVAQAIHVCEGKSIVKNDFSGAEVRGELRDFKLVAHADAGMVHAKVIEEFKKLYNEQKISADDIQIIVPVRARGVNSCRYFNAEIQQIVNGKPSKKAVTLEVTDNGQKFEVTYKPGDRILVTRNNYHAKTIDGSETAIFNGNMGHIIDMDPESMIIELNDKSQIIIPRDGWGDIGLAYAVTCHKCQGSQAPYVIVGLDNSAYPLLMREWLYTALTRAQKYCILVGQPSAINTATRVSNGKVKSTWLKGELHARYIDEVADI
ncbi:MAG: AAA family ATPase [Methanobrevibacter sp.]|nr:AAA family ATPase [Methanobrevibacter sp.]